MATSDWLDSEVKINELQHSVVTRMLNKVVATALYSNHKIQVAAQKTLMESMLPTSIFEKAVGGWEKISIVIKTIRPEKEAIGGEVTE